MLAQNCHNLCVRNVKYICACGAAKWERLFSSDSSQKPDFYEKLGLNRSASQTDIKKAYYDLTLKYHPDRNKGNDEASKKFKEVTEAYEVLGNYGNRKRYDKGMMPLMPGNSSPTAKHDIVEPKVKYQSFFDSRSVASRTQAKRKILDDAEPFQNPFKPTHDDKNYEKSFEETKGQRNLIVIVFGALVLYTLIFKSSE